MDNLFSIGSELIQPEWLEGADVGSGPVDEAETAGGALLTQQMADQLAQKLSGLVHCVALSASASSNYCVYTNSAGVEGHRVHERGAKQPGGDYSKDEHADGRSEC